MNIAKPFTIVCISSLLFSALGCMSCKDHLLISVQDSTSREPVVGANIEIRPPFAILPPPVWRGQTDSNGELRMCVSFDEVGLKMIIHQAQDKVYGRTFYLSDFDKNDMIDSSYELQGEAYPRVRVVVQRLDR